MLLGVIYRPGSQAVSDAFFDDLSAVLEQLAVRIQLSCRRLWRFQHPGRPQRRQTHRAAILRLLQTFDMVQHAVSYTHLTLPTIYSV